MYRELVVVAVLAIVALAGRSPHADKVEQFERSPDGARYSSDVYEDAKLDFAGLLNKYGYTFEPHTVVTEDGYILTAHRIPHGRDSNNQPGIKPVVLIMHGLLSSSADFVVLGPGNALGYFLAEEGYDVWLLNTRGNTFSRNHTTLNPARSGDPEFWHYTWDEIGRYDLPAYFDYILETTGQERVHYIGHSQGGTSILIMMHYKPEYNEKIISFQGLAPAAYFRHNEHLLYSAIAPYERILNNLADELRIGEVLPDSPIISAITYRYCQDGSALQGLCTLYFVNNENLDYFNTTMLPIFLGHAPAGAALRQILHYGQNIKFGTFSRYNFGSLQNLYIYGRTTPPPIDVTRTTVRSFLHYGLLDRETDYKDIEFLAEVMPNAVAMQVPRPTFTHFDFVWGIDPMDQVYRTVLEMMRQSENL